MGYPSLPSTSSISSLWVSRSRLQGLTENQPVIEVAVGRSFDHSRIMRQRIGYLMGTWASMNVVGAWG